MVEVQVCTGDPRLEDSFETEAVDNDIGFDYSMHISPAYPAMDDLTMSPYTNTSMSASP